MVNNQRSKTHNGRGSLDSNTAPYRVLVAVRGEHDLRPLLRLACALARDRRGEVRLLTVTRSGARPSWLELPPAIRMSQPRWLAWRLPPRWLRRSLL